MSAPNWRILVVDDDDSIQLITRIVLQDIEFEGRRLELIQAMSGAEAKEILKREQDIAMILLDVVMETKNAGLDVARFTREELGNQPTRIVLRTGHSGDFPPEEVFLSYDINNYLEKGDLDAAKLQRDVYGALRNYRDILSLSELSVRNNRIVSEAAHGILTIDHTGKIESFNPAAEDIFGYAANDVVGQKISMLMPEEDRPRNDEYLIRYLASGRSKLIGGNNHRVVGQRKDGTSVPLSLAISDMSFDDGRSVLLGIIVDISEQEARQKELEETRYQIIQRLGRAAEFKDNETGMHVMRMSHYSQAIALSAGYEEEFANQLLLAAPMHDVGKIGIPDHVLLKPGKLSDDEWQVMRKHPAMGAGIIGRHGESPLLEMARIVAVSHHEKWDGSGYPTGLAGEDIPLEGRIVAIADVFDALTTERPYKEAWPIDDAVQLLKDEEGRHFDPNLVNVFVGILPQILDIRERFAEKSDHHPSQNVH